MCLAVHMYTRRYVCTCVNTCPSIFLCASLYVALILINSREAKKAGGKVKCAALDIFGEILSKLQFLLRWRERSSSVSHERPSLPTSTPPLQLAYVTTKEDLNIFLQDYPGEKKKEMVWVMQKPPSCHSRPHNQQTGQEDLQIISSAQPRTSQTRKRFQNSATNLKPSQKPRSSTHAVQTGPRRTVMRTNTDQYN